MANECYARDDSAVVLQARMDSCNCDYCIDCAKAVLFLVEKQFKTQGQPRRESKEAPFGDLNLWALAMP